jgi:hypothetical protein
MRPLYAFRALALLLVVACTVPHVLAAPMDYVLIEKQIAEEHAKATKAWLELAHDLAAKGLKSQAADALARARALAPEDPGLAAAQGKVDAVTTQATPDATATKRIAKTHEEVAKAYERIAKVLEKEQQDARYAGSLVTALQLSPTKARQTTLGLMAQKAPLLVSAHGHPYAGWLSLPKSWKPGTPCSLLIVFEGESLQFQHAVNRYAGERKEAAWAVLAPLTFGSGTDLKFDRYFPAYTQKLITDWNGKRNAFDAEGLPGLVDFVRAQFAPGPTTALVSLGRGAEPALGYLAGHAAGIGAASLALAHFDPANLPGPEATKAPEAGGPPIDLLGDPAGPGDPAAWLTERGLRGAVRRAPSGTGPSELAAQQWAWLQAPR